jgi:hypothetical protein
MFRPPESKGNVSDLQDRPDLFGRGTALHRIDERLTFGVPMQPGHDFL